MFSTNKREVIDRVWKNKKYNEKYFIKFLESLGYTVLKVSLAGEYKRFDLKESDVDRTLYINYDENMIIDYVQLIDYRVKKMRSSGWKIGIALAAIGTVGFLVIYTAFSNSDDKPIIIQQYDSNDKDADGDVDYDDTERYLKDSLKEDKNDGDDY